MTIHANGANGASGVHSSWGVFKQDHDGGQNIPPESMQKKLEKNSAWVQAAAAAQSAGAHQM